MSGVMLCVVLAPTSGCARPPLLRARCLSLAFKKHLLIKAVPE